MNSGKGTPEQQALAYAENIIATLREPFVVLDKSLRVRTANAAFYRDFHVSKEETQSRFVYDWRCVSHAGRAGQGLAKVLAYACASPFPYHKCGSVPSVAFSTSPTVG